MGGVSEEGSHVTGSDAGPEREEEEEGDVPIDEALFAAEDLNIEDLDLGEIEIEDETVD